MLRQLSQHAHVPPSRHMMNVLRHRRSSNAVTAGREASPAQYIQPNQKFRWRARKAAERQEGHGCGVLAVPPRCRQQQHYARLSCVLPLGAARYKRNSLAEFSAPRRPPPARPPPRAVTLQQHAMLRRCRTPSMFSCSSLQPQAGRKGAVQPRESRHVFQRQWRYTQKMACGERAGGSRMKA